MFESRKDTHLSSIRSMSSVLAPVQYRQVFDPASCRTMMSVLSVWSRDGDSDGDKVVTVGERDGDKVVTVGERDGDNVGEEDGDDVDNVGEDEGDEVVITGEDDGDKVVIVGEDETGLMYPEQSYPKRISLW